MKEIATGYLRISVRHKNNPIIHASIRCSRIEKGQIVYEDFFMSDAMGNTPTISLYAPDQAYSLSPYATKKPYETYRIEIRRDEFHIENIEDVQIFANEHSFLTIELVKNNASTMCISSSISKIPVHLLFHNHGGNSKAIKKLSNSSRKNSSTQVILPSHVCIHKTARQKEKALCVSFLYYLKNIACSHLYPTWPNEALCANIWILLYSKIQEMQVAWQQNLCSPFDILDDTFIPNRNLYHSICTAVDDTFQSFIHCVYENEHPCVTQINPLQESNPWNILDKVKNGFTFEELIETCGYPYVDITNKKKEVPIRRTNSQIHELQEHINTIAKHYKQVSTIPLTNKLDDPTKHAVADIQRLLGLPIDDILHQALYPLIMQFATECKQI